MPTDAGHRQVYADLVAGLLDARDDPASDRFDDELAAAVARGDLTEDTARRLRFWQRASVRALSDHTRSVLPVVLAALSGSRDDARAHVDELVSTLGPVVQLPETSDTPDPASTAAPGAPSSLGSRPSRLMVADLVLTPPTTHVQQH